MASADVGTEIEMATPAQRHHMRQVMDYLYAHRSQIDYPPGDQRSNRDNVSWRLTEQQAEHVLEGGGRMQLDCSEFCPWVLKCAGCWHWNAPGYTGSHLQLIRPVYDNPKAAGVGALVIFGPGTGHHEAMVCRPDPKTGNPLLQSHGRPGMDRVLLKDMQASQTRAGHPGVRFLSIAHL